MKCFLGMESVMVVPFFANQYVRIGTATDCMTARKSDVGPVHNHFTKLLGLVMNMVLKDEVYNE